MLNYSLIPQEFVTGMEVDEDVFKVLKFIQRNVKCSKMVAVTELVAKLVPILWGHYDKSEIHPMRLVDEKF